MMEIAEMRALINAFEKLIDRHPELEFEMEKLYQAELRSARAQSLEKVFAQ